METPERILIVDDDEWVRVELRGLLELAGYDVGEAVNGRDALASLRRGPLPDVIILDIEMPGMNGVAFRFRQRKEPRMADVPVIIHSIVPQSDTLGGILEASAYLTKPADSAELLRAVRRALGTRSGASDSN